MIIPPAETAVLSGIDDERREKSTKAIHTQDGIFRSPLVPAWDPEEFQAVSTYPQGWRWWRKMDPLCCICDSVGLTLPLSCLPKSPGSVMGAFPFESDNSD